jgi:membrane fusion protein (multidrug efflux system)
MSMLPSLRFLAAATAAAAFACSQPGGGGEAEDAEAAASAVRVRVARVRPAAFEDQVEVTGHLEAERDAVLSARAAGTLEFLAPLGRRVRRGQVVARIDPGLPLTGVKQAEAAKAAAAANLALAEETFRRQKPLYEEGVISALEFQQIQARYEQSKAELARAEASLAQARESVENTRLLAPFSGVVDAHQVDEGEQVSPGTPVLRVVDAATLTVRAGLPERYAADIEVGTPVEVRLPAYGLEPRPGEVRFVATAIDPRSRTFDIEVELDNESGRLKPEMVARLLVTRARLEDALVIDQDAVLRDEEGEHVFVVVDGRRGPVARRRSVEVTGRAGGRVVVEGVKAGARVVVAGQTKLIDGDRVDIEGEGRPPGPASNGVGPGHGASGED